MTFSLFLSNMFFLSKLWNLSSRTVLTGAGPSPNPPPVPMLSLYTPRALFDRQSWRPKGQTLGDDGEWGIPRGFVQKWGTGPEFMAIKKQGKWWWTMEWWNFLKFSGTKPTKPLVLIRELWRKQRYGNQFPMLFGNISLHFKVEGIVT